MFICAIIELLAFPFQLYPSNPVFAVPVLSQVSLQHLPTMQSTGTSGEAPRSGPKMLSGFLAKAQTQATGLLSMVCREPALTCMCPLPDRSETKTDDPLIT